jgi:ABC-type bacteriocin/lantibiotic exporter with double-glycine peptidase domain
MFAFIPVKVPAPQVALSAEVIEIPTSTFHIKPPVQIKTPVSHATSSAVSIPAVPFYSQFTDIQSPAWQQVGCGITSLAMLINFYKPNSVSVNSLLQQGIAAGAYEWGVGWKYGGLIQLSQNYGLTGTFYDLSALTTKTAFAQFKNLLNAGPVILSVHNQFNPQSTVPHLVVIDGIKNKMVYYNDPAAKTGEKEISIPAFLQGWKRKVIAIRRANPSAGSALTLN